MIISPSWLLSVMLPLVSGSADMGIVGTQLRGGWNEDTFNELSQIHSCVPQSLCTVKLLCVHSEYSEREPTEFIQVLSSSNLTTWFLNLMFLSVVLGSSISGLPGLHLQMLLSGLHLRSPEWESLGTELEKASFVGSGTLALSHVHLCLFAYHWFPRTALVQSRCLINTH